MTPEIQKTSKAKSSYDIPKEPESNPKIDFYQNKLIVSGTNVDDNIKISLNSEAGVDIFINGKLFKKTENNSEITLIINAGKGNDNIHIDPKLDFQLIETNAGDGDDKVISFSGPNFINGGNGNDQISVSSFSSIILGGSGDDTITGGFGQDRIYGDAGNDLIDGNDGGDFIDGGEGDDGIISESSKRNEQNNFVYDYHGTNQIKMMPDDINTFSKKDFEKNTVDETVNRIQNKFHIVLQSTPYKIWTISELRNMEKTLNSLPPELLKSIQGYTFTRASFQKNSDKSNSLSVMGDHTNKKITIYDLAFQWTDLIKNSTYLENTIIHEIGHAYKATRMTNGQINRFNNLSQRENNGPGWKHNDIKEHFANEYGMSNPDEDWASSVEYFFTQPKELLKNAPDKYYYLKSLFGK